MTDPATARHEAAHLLALHLLGAGRKVKRVWVDGRDDGIAGKIETELERDIGPQDLVIALVGWMTDGECPRKWPPSWPVDEDEYDAVGRLVRVLKLSEEQYLGLVDVAEDLVAESVFAEKVGFYARGIATAPSMDFESTEILREAAGIPKPEPVGAEHAA